MLKVIASIALPGLTTFAFLCLFLWLAPRFAAGAAASVSFLTQWLLILVLVMPAIAVAILGPSWLFEVLTQGAITKVGRAWLILGGVLMFVVCCFAAIRTPTGRRYSLWRSSVA
jgi:hypothetical protein